MRRPLTEAGARFLDRLLSATSRTLPSDAVAAIVEIEDEAAARLHAGVVAYLNVVSAAEAEGWTFAGGAEHMKGQHPITGDLYTAHAMLAALVAGSEARA